MKTVIIIYVVVFIVLGIIKAVKFTIEMIGYKKSFIEKNYPTNRNVLG